MRSSAVIRRMRPSSARQVSQQAAPTSWASRAISRDAAQLGCRAVPMEPEDPPPAVAPASPPPGAGPAPAHAGSAKHPPIAARAWQPGTTLDGAHVERPAALDHLLGDLGRAQAGRPVGGCSGRGRELEPASALAVQPSGAGDPPALGLEHGDGRLRQVDGPPVDALDDDPLAARAQRCDATGGGCSRTAQ